MHLINCPECGKDISHIAKTCPNCGYYNSLPSKIIGILGIISSIILFITGFGMLGIRSVGGKSVAEIYYQSMGAIIIGISIFILMITYYMSHKLHGIIQSSSLLPKIKDIALNNNTKDKFDEIETRIIGNKIICPKCNSKNSIKKEYCYMCGNKLK